MTRRKRQERKHELYWLSDRVQAYQSMKGPHRDRRTKAINRSWVKNNSLVSAINCEPARVKA